MLSSPNFLFKPEFGGEPSTLPDAKLATSFELAARLGSLLWASVPDDTLLDAAAGGQLTTRAQVAEQARRMAYFSPFGVIGNPPAIEFAHRLTQHTPGDLKHVFFTTGGSTAGDSALRFVHFLNNFHGRKQKKQIITREYAYHGSTYLTISVGNRDGDRTPNFHYLDGFIHHLSAPYPYRRPDGMTEEQFTDHLVEEFKAKIRELGKENIAAFIAEPIQGSGGVVAARA